MATSTWNHYREVADNLHITASPRIRHPVGNAFIEWGSGL